MCVCVCSCPAGRPVAFPSDGSEVAELQKTLISLQTTADEREKQLTELSARLEEAKQKELLLLLEKDEVQEENGVLLENYTRLQASIAELQARVQELLKSLAGVNIGLD